VELMQPGTPDMRQRKTRIFRDRLVEGVLGAVPGRQHAVDAVAVMRCGAVRGRRQRKIVSVPVHCSCPVVRGQVTGAAARPLSVRSFVNADGHAPLRPATNPETASWEGQTWQQMRSSKPRIAAWRAAME